MQENTLKICFLSEFKFSGKQENSTERCNTENNPNPTETQIIAIKVASTASSTE